jgi:hypothetical protein
MHRVDLGCCGHRCHFVGVSFFRSVGGGGGELMMQQDPAALSSETPTKPVQSAEGPPLFCFSLTFHLTDKQDSEGVHQITCVEVETPKEIFLLAICLCTLPCCSVLSRLIRVTVKRIFCLDRMHRQQ